MKIKEQLASLRERKLYIRLIIMLCINMIFFALITIPCLFSYEESIKRLVQLEIFTVILIFSFVYGFLSAEITDTLVLGSLMFAVIGGLYGAFPANRLLELSAPGNYLYCLYFFLRYSLAAFFVSLIIKNTRN